MIVYKITNLINGKVYVGQTTRTIKERLNEHKRSTSPIGKAIRKYGIENFKSELIATCNSLSELNECEIFWIEELDCKVPNGYNVNSGGSSFYSSQCGKNAILMNERFIAQLAMEAPLVAWKVFAILASKQPFEGGIKITKQAVSEQLKISYDNVIRGFKWLKENNYIKERKTDGQTEFLLNPNVTSCGRKRKEKIKLWNSVEVQSKTAEVKEDEV